MIDGYTLLLTVDVDAGRITAARHQVGQAARDCGLPPERLDSFLVAVNEIMVNAVRHGGGRGRVRLWHGGDLVCQVDDQGTGFLASSYLDQTAAPAPSSPGGRGLWLARHTCDSLAVDSGPSGTTVYASVRLPAN